MPVVVKNIKIVKSRLEGELDEYSIADCKDAQSIVDKLKKDLMNHGFNSSGLLYRIFEAKRLDIALSTGTDRDANSCHWDTDKRIHVENKTFLDNEKTLQYTLARLGMKYMGWSGRLCIGVYDPQAFKLIDDIRIVGIFKDKEHKKRLDYLVCVYNVAYLRN